MKCRIHFHNLPDRKPCFNFLKFLLTVPLIIRQYPATPILSGTGKFYLRFRQFVLFSRFSKHFLRKLRSRKAAHYSWYTFPKFFCIPGCKKQFPKSSRSIPQALNRHNLSFPPDFSSHHPDIQSHKRSSSADTSPRIKSRI